MNSRISTIAAIGVKTRALGKDNNLLWKIPGDMKRLKMLTSGHSLIMGRKTFESIGRPLPNRTNIVITRNPEFQADEIIKANSIEEAIDKARQAPGSEEIFIFGGAEIYKQAMPVTDRLYLTLIHDDKEGDVFFPEYPEFTKIIERESHMEENPPFEYLTLERD
ncbi:MAG: diacylglycerol kinase [Parcubacteria group bacterium CG11_big_fil_rev_8_21_14_0_20_39_22]|nr:MAG: diacylglycerol kinase [Parcubacteria group bacterium CG11_big_fil_rev_8_21_14_0_20_39_22]